MLQRDLAQSVQSKNHMSQDIVPCEPSVLSLIISRFSARAQGHALHAPQVEYLKGYSRIGKESRGVGPCEVVASQRGEYSRDNKHYKRVSNS
eukprot:3064394-Amphidinium_carterae.1